MQGLNASSLLDRLPRPPKRGARPGFTWNVLVMLTGTLAGQSVSVLLSPVLTRLFAPSEFGYLSVYSALLGILGVMASLGLDLAIPIAGTEFECANLMALCGFALVVTTAMTALLMLIPADLLADMSLGPLVSYRYLVPIGFACLGGYYIMVAVATWASAFKDIARTRVSQGISGPVSQIIFGLIGCGTPGLVVGWIIGQSSGTLLLMTRVVLRRTSLLREISWPGMASAARRYVHFPLFASWARLLDVAGGGTILFVLFTACYSSKIAGFMFLSERVIGRPLLVLSTSFLQVFTGEAGRAINNNPALLRQRFYQVVPLQFLLAACWVLLANAVADWAFPRLFGEQWADAIPYLRALSLSYLALTALHPVSTTLQLVEWQVAAALWQVARLILVVASVLLAWHAGASAVTALWLSSIAQTVSVVVVLGLMIVSIERVARRR
jgi:O-antigen/teichoic acid export membrane protein